MWPSVILHQHASQVVLPGGKLSAARINPILGDVAHLRWKINDELLAKYFAVSMALLESLAHTLSLFSAPRGIGVTSTEIAFFGTCPKR